MPAGQANLTLIDPAPSLTINGNGLNNIIYGSWASETLTGGGGDDILIGGSRRRLPRWRLGLDTAVFSGPRSAYVLTRSGTSLNVLGPDGSDTLTGIEKLAFTDGTIPSGLSPAPSDFNGDGKADILWQNDNGTPAIWTDGRHQRHRCSGPAQSRAYVACRRRRPISTATARPTFSGRTTTARRRSGSWMAPT